MHIVLLSSRKSAGKLLVSGKIKQLKLLYTHFVKRRNYCARFSTIDIIVLTYVADTANPQKNKIVRIQTPQ